MNKKTKTLSINLPAKLLKASAYFQAKNDIRYYLEGVHLNKEGFIEATNGHILLRCSCDEVKELDENIIINIGGGAIPSRAHMAVLTIDIDTMDGRVVFMDGYENMLKKHGVIDGRFLSVVDGTFPDTKKVLKGIIGKPKVVESIGINAEYMSTVGKASKALGCSYPVAEFVFYGKEKPIKAYIKNTYCDAMALIMPCHL